MTVNALDMLALAKWQIARDHAVRAFADLADDVSRHRPLYWRWTSHLAAAIALRKNGIA